MDDGKPAAAAPSGTAVDEEAARKDAAAKATAGKNVGDELTAEQAAAVRKDFDGTRVAYPTTDGRFILVDSQQALPGSVKADAGRKVGQANQADAAAKDPGLAHVAALNNSLATDTGHRVVIVSHAYTYVLPAGESMGWVWVTTAIGGQEQFPDAASAVAASQTAKPGAEIIVSQ